MIFLQLYMLKRPSALLMLATIFSILLMFRAFRPVKSWVTTTIPLSSSRPSFDDALLLPSSHHRRRPLVRMLLVHRSAPQGGAAAHSHSTTVMSTETNATAEVVGATGRMGSFFLRQAGRDTMALPRGVAPGCLSVKGSPIYVAVPSKEWNSVLEQTLDDRWDDLVWIGNGLLLDEQRKSTVVIPHFGILSVHQDPVTAASSPPTLVYGKHANDVTAILTKQQQHEIQVQQVSSWSELCVHAAKKVLWASCMWLLCHDPNLSSPLTLAQVHAQKQDTLVALVKELFPVLQSMLSENKTSNSDDDDVFEIDIDNILDYMEKYSLSMPDAVPSIELAKSELLERNGIWLSASNVFPQPLHRQLLALVLGPDAAESLLQKSLDDFKDRSLSKKQRSSSLLAHQDNRRVELADIRLTCIGCERINGKETPSSIVIVGGGIIGSSIALMLARRGCMSSITVIDPTEVGKTTPASWAWLNANQKTPLSYRLLNQLGMRAWRLDPFYRELPAWNGSLVCREKPLEIIGGYALEGPLTNARIHQIEPEANFTDGYIYYFRDEGCVSPCQAVKEIRRAAKRLGVNFVPDQNVTGLVRNEDGRVIGIQSKSVPSDHHEHLADTVLVAAGTGAAAKDLGGVPLLSSPGRLSFGRPATSTARLKKVLVDTIRESHVLQRDDGTLVSGGGAVQTGGSLTEDKADPLLNDGRALFDAAKELAPVPVGAATFAYSEKAVRPMPKDGLPVAGYLEPGLYTVVTHSGITLSPIISQLVASELTDQMDLELLRPYRPTRFNES